MNLDVEQLPGGIARVALSGRLDVRGAEAVELRFAATVADQSARTIVDLSGVEFVASMGLRMLMVTARSAARKDAKFALYGASGSVRDVLDMAGIGALIPMAPDEAGARAAIGG